MLAAHSAFTYLQAVVGKTMPLGNLTKMTQAERDPLGRWIDGGAQAK